MRGIDVTEILGRLHVWARIRVAGGIEGWVPLSCFSLGGLSPISESASTYI